MKYSGKIITLFVVFIATISDSYAQYSEQMNKELASMTFQIGVKKLITQQPTKATKYFDRTIELTDSTHGPALYYKAMTISDNKPDEALYLINKATSGWNDNINFLEAKAQLQNKLYKYAEAQKTYNKLNDLVPNNPYYIYYCAVLGAVNSNFNDANKFATEYEIKFGFHEKIYDIKYDYFLRNNEIDSLNDYVITNYESQSNSPTVVAHYGQIMSTQGKDSIALNAYKKSIQLDPNNPKYYMSLIDYYLTHKNYKELLNSTNELFNLEGIRAEFKINLISEFLRYIEPHGEHKENIIELAKIVVRKEPDNAAAMQFYVSLLSFVNQNDKAYAFLKNKYDKGELNEDMVYTLLMYIYNSDDKENIIEITDNFLTIYPENIEINNFMLAILSINKEYKKLSKLADKIIDFTKNDSIISTLYVAKASATEHISSHKKTIRDFEYAIKYDPNNAMAFNNYAYFLAQKSINLDQALILANKALELNPKDVNYIDTKAWVYFKMKMYNEAHSLMINILTINNKLSDEVTLHLGDILYAKGSELLARDKWENIKDKSLAEEINERLLLKANDVEGLLQIIHKYE